MHGNRDFLLGDRFARETGCRLMAETEVVDLYGVSTLLMHGDQLCTDDVGYQAFRRMARDRGWQRDMLARPLAERRALARQARDRSAIENAMKAEAIMDVNADAVTTAMRGKDVSRMIHGHTHRPAVHLFKLDGETATRIVLGDWYDQGSVLRVDADGFKLTSLSL
jgi:UDP-2,3-diacylglucosamine hydrolase